MREESVEGLRLKVSFVGDAYRYRMAEGIKALREKNYKGSTLERKLRSLYSKCKKLSKKWARACRAVRGGCGRHLLSRHIYPGWANQHLPLLVQVDGHVDQPSAIEMIAVASYRLSPGFEARRSPHRRKVE